ncbi:MAG TPA: hypothetical protein VE569_06900 [Acidimicrobiia bacterium]|nr:hypothetical protein [Acidimicrobiia bacterium]
MLKLGIEGIPGSASPAEQRERAGISSEAMRRTIIDHVAQRVPAL